MRVYQFRHVGTAKKRDYSGKPREVNLQAVPRRRADELC
jgi:hypothetical protein